MGERIGGPMASAPSFRPLGIVTIAELADREGIAKSYMTRVMRLTLLAPDIVEAILDGRQGPEVTLARVLEPFPLAWNEQQNAVGAASSGDGNKSVLSPRRSIGY